MLFLRKCKYIYIYILIKNKKYGHDIETKYIFNACHIEKQKSFQINRSFDGIMNIKKLAF